VFHLSSSLFGVDQREILVDPIASFRQDLANQPPPASKKQKRQEEIIIVVFFITEVCHR